MDQLRAMAVFAAVVETGNFIAASERLNLSRTATSKLVKDLELHLGVALLTRTTRRVGLTQAGAAYYEHVRHILDRVEEADREAAAVTSNPQGRVRVSAPMSFAIRHLAPRLTPFMEAYPNVGMDLVLNDREVDLIGEGYDFAVRIGTLEDSSLIARRIATTRLVLCAAPAYLARAGRPTALADLSRHVCLAYPYRSGQDAWILLDGAGRHHQVPVSNQLWCNNGDALLNVACSGGGIVLQPNFIAHEALAAGELVPLLDDYSGPEVGIYVIYPPAPFMPLRVRALIDYFAGLFAGETPWQAT